MTRGIDPPEVEGYQWDGWKLIMIAKVNTNGTFHSRKWSCVWRPDVGSSLYARSDWMRAGGVGGVAWLQTGAVQSYSYGTGGAEVHVPLADHMGNVRHYYQFRASGKSVTGQLVASYEYDAFGREVRAWGLNTPTENQPPGLPASRPWADLLPFHYSSKLRDVDSGFNYYGYRFYDPGAGRWLNRDPIGERGGVNLYGMVGNDAINWIDSLGLSPGNGSRYPGLKQAVEEIEEGFGISSVFPDGADPLDDSISGSSDSDPGLDPDYDPPASSPRYAPDPNDTPREADWKKQHRACDEQTPPLPPQNASDVEKCTYWTRENAKNQRCIRDVEAYTNTHDAPGSDGARRHAVKLGEKKNRQATIDGKMRKYCKKVCSP